MSREMKDSGVEWIGEIPEDWEIIPNKHLMKKVKNLCPVYNGEDILSLSMKGVYVRDPNDESGKRPTTYNGYQYVQEGDLLMCLFDIDVTPRCVGRVYNNGLTSPAYSRFVMNKTRAIVDYYYYYYLALDFDKTLLHLSKNMRSSLTESDFGSINAPVPSPTEQQQIVHFLDRKCTAIDTAIEKTKKSIEKLEEYKKAVITKAVTKGIDSNAKMKDSGVEWIGEIPEGWNIGRVKFLLDERNERSIYGKEEPLSMSQKIGIIPTKQMNQVPHIAASFVNAKICYPNDLVFNKLKAHLGVFSVSEYHGVVSPDYAVYFENKYSHAKYLEYLFKTPQCINEFKKRITGVGQGLSRLYTSELYDVIVPIPTKEEQIRIANEIRTKCKAINNLIKKKQTAINKLEEYKKSLIYYAVTGKIDCRGEEL